MRSWTRSLAAVAVAIVAVTACGDNREVPIPDAAGPRHACADGKDNDGDGKIDYPRDPGCIDAESDTEESPIRPRCNDGVDNDKDGRVDYPADPGCINPQSDEEADDCPNGPFCPQCSNGRDDDQSGNRDFPLDPGCESAADNFEYDGNPQACGTGLELKELPVGGVATGTIDPTSVVSLGTPCGGGNVPAVGFVMILTQPKVVVMSTAGSAFDTVLDLRMPRCTDPDAELACHDNVSTSDNSSTITRELPAGVYYIIVEGKSATQLGAYRLKVELYSIEGQACTVQSDCASGLVCRIPLGGSQKICTRPVCSDGTDDDGDGKIDWPNDPGCTYPGDPDEADACPSDPGCPACSDGVDNDGDGQSDYPFDDSCKAAGDLSEACVTSEKPINVITTKTTTGTTVGAVNDDDPTCNAAAGLAPDVLYRIDLPSMLSLSLNVTGFDTVTTLLDSSCVGPPVVCSHSPLVTRTNVPAGTYYVSIEGFNTTSGAFTLTTTGVIAPGGSCEGALFQSGAIACESGVTCGGPTGARTCIPTQCSDGLDNNGDGNIDFPTDPGCASLKDPFEDTVCPGTSCPECADGTDNDLDGTIDYPADSTCKSAGGVSELCGQSEPIASITTPVTAGTTVGAVNDYDPTCNSASGLAPDLLYEIDVPLMASLSLNVVGFDTVTTLLNATCGGTPIRCSDPPLMTVTNLAAGRYYVGVEGYSTTSGAFTITTSGQVAPNQSCEGALFQSGALTCTSGFACNGTVGTRTCTRTQCSDGIDNNGDGKADFPADPGCQSASDNLEDTVCPGAACPVCSDGVDNDNDGLIDYPADTTCTSAAGMDELCRSLDPVVPIVSGTTVGTLVGAIDDHNPSCGSDGGPDQMFTLDLPAMVTLTLDTEGSTITDTLLSFMNGTCAEPSIQCDDDSGTGLLSLISRTNVPAGRYIVAVDAYSTGTTLAAFRLNMAGTIAPGSSCESALFQSGAISCTSGFACNGTPGTRTCSQQCSDGRDNNGDGRMDYPADPGCTSPTDATENTVCPGASCPVCSNMVDDDGDGLIDWPADPGCLAASGTSELFCGSDPDYRGPITLPVTMGTLAAPAADNRDQSCQANTGNEVTYLLDSPLAATWVISTEGSTIADTVLAIYDPSCTGAPLACDDDSGTGPLSRISIALPAGSFAVQVDSYTQTANNGPFQLNVQGTVAPDADCTSPLFASGVLVCATGQTCTTGVCQ